MITALPAFIKGAAGALVMFFHYARLTPPLSSSSGRFLQSPRFCPAVSPMTSLIHFILPARGILRVLNGVTASSLCSNRSARVQTSASDAH